MDVLATTEVHTFHYVWLIGGVVVLIAGIILGRLGRLKDLCDDPPLMGIVLFGAVLLWPVAIVIGALFGVVAGIGWLASPPKPKAKGKDKGLSSGGGSRRLKGGGVRRLPR